MWLLYVWKKRRREGLTGRRSKGYRRWKKKGRTEMSLRLIWWAWRWKSVKNYATTYGEKGK